MKQRPRGVPQASKLGSLLVLVVMNDLGADENWHSEVVKHADDTVMIEKLTSKCADKNMFRTWMNKNGKDFNYTKSEFVVFEKRSAIQL